MRSCTRLYPKGHATLPPPGPALSCGDRQGEERAIRSVAAQLAEQSVEREQDRPWFVVLDRRAQLADRPGPVPQTELRVCAQVVVRAAAARALNEEAPRRTRIARASRCECGQRRVRLTRLDRLENVELVHRFAVAFLRGQLVRELIACERELRIELQP